MKCLEVRKPFNRQAVFVFFALEIPSCKEFGKPLTSALCFRTVGNGAVYAQGAINGRFVHRTLMVNWVGLRGKAGQPTSVPQFRDTKYASQQPLQTLFIALFNLGFSMLIVALALAWCPVVTTGVVLAIIAMAARWRSAALGVEPIAVSRRCTSRRFPSSRPISFVTNKRHWR
jgi:hypothetical protein